MPFERVGDVIDRVRGFRRELQRIYEDAAADHGNHHLELLLDYMGRHEKYFEEGLARFQDESARSIRDTWIQYVPDKQVRKAIEDVELTPDLGVDEIIRRSLEVDRALIALYHGLATSLAMPRVRELFQRLLELEETKGKEHSKSVAELLEDARKSKD